MKFLLLLLLFSLSEGYRILVVFPLPGPSHAILGEGIASTLADGGHDVTYITPFPLKKSHPNITIVDISSIKDKMPAASKDMQIMNLAKHSFSKFQMAMMGPFLGSSALENEELNKFIMDPTIQFDLVINEWFYHNVFAGFSALYQCPYAWVGSTEPHWMILKLIDEAPNPAYSADLLSKSVPPFDFVERVSELYTQLYTSLLTGVASFFLERPVYNKVFGEALQKRGYPFVPMSDVAYNSSFVFVNGHPTLAPAYNLPQNTKYIGGYHIDPKTKPLPADLQKICDDAKHGVIYFSMGSNLQSKDLSPEIKADLIKTFGKLKQTVIWKFEEELKDLPKNLHVVKWAPQPSILNHPNTILFITHGGRLSTVEAIYYGVPVIGVPIFGDQFSNMISAANKGYGILAPFSDKVADAITEALKEFEANPSYTQKAKEISIAYHHRPVTPRQELLHWVEHIIITKGARHLRSPAFNTPWYQKLYLDLIVVILIALHLLRKVSQKFCTKCKKNKKTKKD